MESIDTRLALKTQVLAYTDQHPKSIIDTLFRSVGCFTADGTYMGLRVEKKLGKGENVQGDAYKTCVPEDGGCAPAVALKLVLPTTGNTEIEAMDLVEYIIVAKLCPNLPLMYLSSKCGDCRFASGSMWVSADALKVPEPGEWKRPSDSTYTKYDGGPITCTTILSEFASGGDLDHWLSAPRSEKEIANVLFQVFCGIYAIWRNCGMTHNDLHTGNVLVHIVPPGGVWEYVIDGITYYCPNIGVVAVLWDFGFAIAPGLIAPQEDFVEDNGFMYGYTRVESADARRLLASVAHGLRRRPSAAVSRMLAFADAHMDADVGMLIHRFFRTYLSTTSVPDATYFMDRYTDLAFFENMDTAEIRRLASVLDGNAWAALLANRGLSVAEIREFEPHVDFAYLSRVVTDREVVAAFADRLDWAALSRWTGLGEALVRAHIDKIDFARVSQYQTLSAAFWLEHRAAMAWEFLTDGKIERWCTAQLREAAAYVPWSRLSLSTRTDKSLAQLADLADWGTVSRHRPLSLAAVAQFEKYIVPEMLTLNPTFPLDDVAAAFPALIVWPLVARPAPSTMRRYADKLDWSLVSRTIDEALVPEFEAYIDWAALQEHNTLSSTTIQKYIRHMDLAVVSRTQVLSDAFVRRHADSLDWSVLRATALSQNSCDEFARDINWGMDANLDKLLTLDTEFVARHPRTVNVRKVSARLGADDSAFIRRYAKFLDWSVVSSSGRSLSGDIVWEFRENITFDMYTGFAAFTTSDYTRLAAYVNWTNVARHAPLSAAVLRMFAPRAVNPALADAYAEFDWAFFRVNRDAVNWGAVVRLPDLPETFRREFDI